ncbi:NADH-ubiquinone oxidoreductase subunit 3 (mitochondrion) [Cyanidioschyzon merolae]|jgi:NADH-quinone oxidoreductase subunit A|uniref:NADH-ubiquinone oxidoreductase chain 3 n=2 Tax=Cyanidioschyzon merolae TaxID=45157 RepID=Q9ZZQ4_CYAM1|nr:NADH dehydrogenase subunit 3 [Cyanidioschyzon merolae]BAA34661.1 NADH-ubiquinone oxidoreductase chain 3 [Cyanidioschyzon merolae strain 10D]BBU60041.1 NADH-ubiquinone oxidoreductase subunit 3 [Cyanidioschyzon merolae]
MFKEYSILLTFICLTFLLATIVFILSYIFSVQKADAEKISAYECGFNPFDDARTTFDIRFYLVAILFLIFDLEVSFLYPWSVCIGYLNNQGFYVICTFLFILTIGFLYEWFKGALDWE